MHQNTETSLPLIEFEKTVTELTTLIEQLETGQAPLADSLERFEKGIQLIRQCQQALHQAEQTVQRLTQEQLEPMSTDE